MTETRIEGLAPWEPIDAEFTSDECLVILQKELHEYRKRVTKRLPKDFLKRVDDEIRTDSLCEDLLERLKNGAVVEAGPLTVTIKGRKRIGPRRLVVEESTSEHIGEPQIAGIHDHDAADLAQVTDAWPDLPDELKVGILAMIKSVTVLRSESRTGGFDGPSCKSLGEPQKSKGNRCRGSGAGSMGPGGDRGLGELSE